MQEYRLLIGGKLVLGAGTMDVINPATAEVFAKAPRANEAQLNEAVAAAKGAFRAWSTLGFPERRVKLLALADDMQERIDALARVLTSEQGKPLASAKQELLGAVNMIRRTSELDLPDEVLRQDSSQKTLRVRTALGVIAVITPWNYPVSLMVAALAPALITGNTVVAKPAPTTPLTCLLLAEIANRHLPGGVLNVITDQNDLGGSLTRHPDVAKISFTGSTVTGRKVMESASSSVKRVSLELGGNDAAIVLDDASVKAVAPRIFAGAMMNSGQVCAAIKRVYVADNLYDEMCTALADLANAAVVDDGLKQGTQYGPLQNKMQFDKVTALIEDSRRSGKIVAGGSSHEGPGYFVRPTIVRDILDDARLVREEQFGPVLPVLRYRTEAEAIERANDTIYGLTATVWTGDPERGLTVAKQLDAGSIWVNDHLRTDPSVSSSPSKQSGVGDRAGKEGLASFTQSHIVNVSLSS